MKSIAFAFIALVTGVSALPPQVDNEISMKQERFVDIIVAAALESLSEQIRDAGLDPWTFDQFAAEYALPVPVLFSGSGFIENVRVTGVSDIVINSINYSILQSRLTFDISLPNISINIGGAGLDVIIFSNQITLNGNGRLSIIEPRVSGVVNLNIGIISGIFIRDLALEFDLGGVQFNGNVNFLGVDYTNAVTQFATVTVPEVIRAHRLEINELVEIIAWDVIESILN